MGLTSLRLRERLAHEARTGEAPAALPSTLSYDDHARIVQELTVRYERELSALRAGGKAPARQPSPERTELELDLLAKAEDAGVPPVLRKLLEGGLQVLSEDELLEVAEQAEQFVSSLEAMRAELEAAKQVQPAESTTPDASASPDALEAPAEPPPPETSTVREAQPERARGRRNR